MRVWQEKFVEMILYNQLNMCTKRVVALMLLMVSLSLTAVAQYYAKPKEPTFDYMTINLVTGNPTLYWTAPTYDPQYPNPTGYIIYKQMPNALGNVDYFAIDTVDDATYSYTDSTSNGNQARLFYRIASNGPTEPSRQTLYHANIWLTSAYDSCNAVLKLNWESYDGWKNENISDHYKLYISNSSDFSTFTRIDTVDKFDNKYYLKNVKENTDYYFYLTASRNDVDMTTFSNLYYKRTVMPFTPSYMTVDSVLASDNGTQIYYSIDSITQLSKFKVLRWEYPDTNKILFSAKVIDEFSDNSRTFSVDTSDTWAARTRLFYYKLDAYNSCNAVVKVSNLCNTVVPVPTPGKTTVKLEWDPLYIDTVRIPSRIINHVSYKIFRIVYAQGVDLAQIGEVVEIANVSNSSFTDDISNYRYMNPPYQFTFKYYVEAREYTPVGKEVTLSRSRVVTTEIKPSVVMPDAIAPTMYNMAHGHSRNILAPVISFDAQYELTIYDRWGTVIYHGNSGWNGKYPSGEYAIEGTYLYRLEVYTNDSGSVVKTGHVSVVYPEK